MSCNGFSPTRLVLILLATIWPATAFASCGVTTPTDVTVGGVPGFSPSAIKAGVVPLTKTNGGFGCSSAAILSLLSGNTLKATVASNAVLKLTSTTTSDTVTYKLYADSAGTTELKPGVDAYYINGTLINLLGLLGNGAIDVPVYFKLASAAYPAPGIYKGSFSILWDWHFCSGVGVLGACILFPDNGTTSATVNVTLNVQPNPPTVAIDTGATTWNVVEGTSNPKAIPGSKRRLTVTITNPDIVAVEGNTLQVELPTPSNLVIALDGDGAGGAVVQTAQGGTPSTLTLNYIASDSTADDVDFSVNGGTSWTAAPIAGNATSQATINRVRMRPQGSMAAQSSFVITIPYSVK